MRARYQFAGSLLCTSLAATALLAACTKSSTAPSDPASNKVVQGQAVDAIAGAGLGGVSVQVGPAYTVLTDGNGYFQADVGGPGTYRTTVTGSSVVERRTTVTGPSSDRVRLSLIPASFDLTAFDEMFRTVNSRLQRWTTAPPLVIVTRVMAFENRGDAVFTTGSEEMSDDEVAQLQAHMTEGLTLLTGNTYTRFASVDIERPAAGERVTVLRVGKIIAARYTGIKGFGETIGYGTWHEESDGRVTGGSMFLDRDFDKGDDRRRLLRIHELGHALGYLHVTVRESVMNPSLGPEPTDFDRAGAKIAFQRPPGNVNPDVDPGAGTAFGQSAAATGHWAPRVP